MVPRIRRDDRRRMDRLLSTTTRCSTSRGRIDGRARVGLGLRAAPSRPSLPSPHACCVRPRHSSAVGGPCRFGSAAICVTGTYCGRDKILRRGSVSRPASSTNRSSGGNHSNLSIAQTSAIISLGYGRADRHITCRLSGIEIAVASGKPELVQCRTERFGPADSHGTLAVAHLADGSNIEPRSKSPFHSGCRAGVARNSAVFARRGRCSSMFARSLRLTMRRRCAPPLGAGILAPGWQPLRGLDRVLGQCRGQRWRRFRLLRRASRPC